MDKMIFEKKVMLEEGLKKPLELDYYLIESHVNGFDEFDGMKAFGIGIMKKTDDSGTEVERQEIKNFSFCRDAAREMLSKLAENTVTPSSLVFVLDDLIGI